MSDSAMASGYDGQVDDTCEAWIDRLASDRSKRFEFALEFCDQPIFEVIAQRLVNALNVFFVTIHVCDGGPDLIELQFSKSVYVQVREVVELNVVALDERSGRVRVEVGQRSNSGATILLNLSPMWVSGSLRSARSG